MKRFPVALLLGVLTAVSLTVASPANADTSGPLRNAGTRKCLTPVSASQGAAVVQRPCDIDRGVINRAQEWDAVCKDSSCSVFHMVNHESLLCLDARGGATNGTPIQVWSCNAISNENWDYGATSGQSDRDNPNFVLRSRVSGTSSQCLDVPGSQATDGLAMHLWGCNGTAAQLWLSGPKIIE